MPSSKLLLSYNIPYEKQDAYLRFMLNQFIPRGGWCRTIPGFNSDAAESIRLYAK
ncbi:MAG: hypothetical protein HY257_07940 [Chloroflexi bacterium]|nr:hypothetical protein [Chloroflexota bacterium]